MNCGWRTDQALPRLISAASEMTKSLSHLTRYTDLQNLAKQKLLFQRGVSQMRSYTCLSRFLQINRIKPAPSGKEEVKLKESKIFLADGFHIYLELTPISKTCQE